MPKGIRVTDKMFEALEHIASYADKGGYFYASAAVVAASTFQRLYDAGLIERRAEECPTCGHETDVRWFASPEGNKILEGRP